MLVRREGCGLFEFPGVSENGERLVQLCGEKDLIVGINILTRVTSISIYGEANLIGKDIYRLCAYQQDIQ